MLMADVPRFALYGEAPNAGAPAVHVELIETRSRARNWRIGEHTHAGLFQVVILLAGEVQAQVEQAHVYCHAPVAITIHPAAVHGFTFSNNAHGYVLTIDQHALFAALEQQGERLTRLFVAPCVIGLDRAAVHLDALLANMLDEVRRPQAGGASMLDWLACSVLLHLARAHTRHDAPAGGDFALFTRFRAIVERRYREAATLDEYARALRVPSARLNRACRDVAGKSAFDIVQERLMMEACRRLRQSRAVVASIAYELGYEDPAYFSRAFKRRMGVTPTQYRQGPTTAPPARPGSSAAPAGSAAPLR